MTAALLAANGSKTLWYLTRGSGAVTLVLLTVSMSLGIAGTFRRRSSLFPRFRGKREQLDVGVAPFGRRS